jgi:hypothetical protein
VINVGKYSGTGKGVLNKMCCFRPTTTAALVSISRGSIKITGVSTLCITVYSHCLSSMPARVDNFARQNFFCVPSYLNFLILK